jgi:carbon storage regulator
MLVLTRRIGEEIVIDGSIRVTIVAIQEGRVRLGVTAPENVRVDRQEIHERRTHADVPDRGGRGRVPLNRNG